MYLFHVTGRLCILWILKTATDTWIILKNKGGPKHPVYPVTF